jgi:uncharacterized protein YdhG (YjbR/CyaY superfamily)
MEPVGIFMGICIDLSKKKTKLADFVIKKEHLGFLPDLAIPKRQRHRVEI